MPEKLEGEREREVTSSGDGSRSWHWALEGRAQVWAGDIHVGITFAESELRCAYGCVHSSRAASERRDSGRMPAKLKHRLGRGAGAGKTGQLEVR